MKYITPIIRFKEFKDNWKFEPIGKYIELISGIALKGAEISEDENGIPILRGINITEGYIRHSLDIDRFYLGNNSNIEKYYLKIDDLVLGMDGSKVGKNVALITEKDENSILIQRVARIRSNEKSNIKYIYQQIFSKKFHDYVDTVNTSSGIPHISSQQIKDFSIGFPSLDEQNKIAYFLTSVDEKINLLKEKKHLLEEYKKGIMQQIFTQKIRFKDENEKQFDDWKEKALGDIADFFKGKGLPKNHISDDGIYKCIHYGELFTKYKELIKNIKSKTDIYDKPFLSKSNDVLMPTSDVTPNGLATASCILEDGVILGGDVLIIRQKKIVLNGLFLSYFIAQFREKVMKLVSGSTVYHLYGSDMKKLIIFIPCIKEQNKIAEFILAIDEKIELVNVQISETQEYKKGLLQQMFV